MDDVRTFTGTLVADLILPESRGLKERRGPLRALVQKLKNHHYAVAQVGPADLVQRAFLAVSAVSGTDSQVENLLDGAERIIIASEFEVARFHRTCQVDSFHSG